MSPSNAQPPKSSNAQIFNKGNTQVLSERSDIINRWGKHFDDLLNCESAADQGGFDKLTLYPTRE